MANCLSRPLLPGSTRPAPRPHLAWQSATSTGVPGDPGRDLDLSYTYDDVGNVTQIGDVRGGETQDQAFCYDALDRLTSAATSGSGLWGSYSEGYTCDTIGNLTSKGGVSYYLV